MPSRLSAIALPNHPTVVVADDDPALRLLCRVNLELEGYRVLEASSRAELMSALAAEPVAAVLLDVHLGDDDGIEIARELDTSHPEIGIALFTGSVDSAQVSAGDLTDAFLAKPFTLEELSATVARVARS